MDKNLKVGMRVEIAPWYFSDMERNSHDGTIEKIRDEEFIRGRYYVVADQNSATGWYHSIDLWPISNTNQE